MDWKFLHYLVMIVGHGVSLINISSAKTIEIPRNQPRPCISIKQNDYERSNELISLINNYREEHGLTKLEVDSSLEILSKHKGFEYYKTREWDHSISGRNYIEIYRDCDVKFDSIGEILARGYDGRTDLIMHNWMLSPSHNEVILEPSWTRFSIFVGDKDLDYYVVGTFSD